MVTPFELALMCQKAYTADKSHLNNEWLFLASEDFNNEGYHGVAYLNQAKRHIVIAHRGTNIIIFKNLLTDANLIVNAITPSFKQARDFSIRVREQNKKDKKFTVIETGHSLGGVYAHYNAHYFNTKSVAFDSPGCLKLLNEPNSNAQINPANFTTYLSAPHAINTLHTHVGRKIRVYVPHVDINGLTTNNLRQWLDFKEYICLGSTIISKLANIEWSTLQRLHALENMINAFDPNIGHPYLQAEMDKWPSLMEYLNAKAYTLVNKIDFYSAAIKWCKYYIQNDVISMNQQYETELLKMDSYKYPALFLIPRAELAKADSMVRHNYIQTACSRFEKFYNIKTDFNSELKKIYDNFNKELNKPLFAISNSKIIGYGLSGMILLLSILIILIQRQYKLSSKDSIIETNDDTISSSFLPKI